MIEVTYFRAGNSRIEAVAAAHWGLEQAPLTAASRGDFLSISMTIAEITAGCR
jgi:hypothetical protein